MAHDGYRSVLVLGGIRSGKSAFAESLVAESLVAESLVGHAAGVRYIATSAPAGDDDDEWAGRLAAHQARRPAHWSTEEVGADPERLATLLAQAKPDETLLVDDLGGWLTAVLAASGGPLGVGWSAESAREPVAALTAAAGTCAARLVIVSPEVGLAIVPATTSGRVFTDAIGLANRALATALEAVVLVVAGQPTWLKAPSANAPAGRAARAPATPPELVEAAPVDGASTGADIDAGLTLPLPDQIAASAATARLVGLDVPGPGLGALARVVELAAGARGEAEPATFASVRVVLVYGVHTGDVAAGEQPADWTRRLDQLRAGEGALGLLASRAGASVQIVDTSQDAEPAGPIESADATGPDSVAAGLRHGWRLADSAVDAGTDLVILAAGGPGQDAAAAAIVAVNTYAEVPALLARVITAGGRIDDNAWMLRCAAVRDARHRVRTAARDPRSMLAALGGYDLAVATGLILGLAARQTPVLVDGPVGIAAGLLANDFALSARLWLLLAEAGRHPTVTEGARVLGLSPLVDLGLGLGEGAGALAVLPLIQNALLISTVDSIDRPARDGA